jgi:hypothetical protein
MSAALLIAFMAGALLSLAPVAIYEKYTKRMRK